MNAGEPERDIYQIAARDSEERLRLALKAGGLASWDWDMQTGEMAWSEEHYRIQGYPPGSVIPSLQAWRERVHPDDRDEAVRVLLRAREERIDYVHEFRCLLPDGTLRYCSARGLFYYDGTGAAVRMIGVMEDVTEQRHAERALQESEARFRQFGDASSDVLWIRNAKTLELEYLSPAFDAIYGVDRAAMLAQPGLESWIQLILPEDRHAVHSAIEAVRSGRRIVVEYRIRRRGSGDVRWMRNTKFPLLDDAGRVVRIGGIGHDATEEKEAIGRMQVMMGELQHRTRNLMAVVRSIADRTLQECDTLDQFGRMFSDRITAIARVQGLLSRLTDGDKVAFDELLGEELRAHGADLERARLEGPAGVKLRSTTLQIFALALHELATNAVKYGALSTESGRLTIRWNKDNWEDGTPVLRVEWVEKGVSAPAGTPSLSGGYGRELIEKALPYQLKARTSYRLEPTGVRCTVEVPLSS